MRNIEAPKADYFTEDGGGPNDIGACTTAPPLFTMPGLYSLVATGPDDLVQLVLWQGRYINFLEADRKSLHRWGNFEYDRATSASQDLKVAQAQVKALEQALATKTRKYNKLVDMLEESESELDKACRMIAELRGESLKVVTT